MRITLQNVMESRIPQVAGFCNSDTIAVASLINEAQQRLIGAATETGWWGGWAKVVFSITTAAPYLTLPPQFSRIVNLDLCKFPIRVQNSWYEVLVDGIGLREAGDNRCNGPIEAYDRELVSTAVDLPPTNQLLRLYLTDIRDVGKRVLFSGALDQNHTGIYSTDGLESVNGFYLTLQSPFITSAFIVTSFAAIAKPVTYGDLVLKSVDASTGAEIFLGRYTPSETNPAWRRYLISGVPGCCCVNGVQQTPQVTALAKYEYQPVRNLSDFLIIGNIPALKEEVMSIRMSEMDSSNGTQLAEVHHRKAIRLLSQELQHYLGSEMPAIVVKPFQTIGLNSVGLNLQMM